MSTASWKIEQPVSNCLTTVQDEDKWMLMEHSLEVAMMEQKGQWQLVLEWMKCAAASSMVSSNYHESKMRVYLLPGTSHLTCKNALARVISYGKVQSVGRQCKASKKGRDAVTWQHEQALQQQLGHTGKEISSTKSNQACERIDWRCRHYRVE